MNKRSLVILFLFLCLVHVQWARNTSFKAAHCHFHFSNNFENAKFSQAYPIIEEQLVFDIQDTDIRPKQEAVKHARNVVGICNSFSGATLQLQEHTTKHTSPRNQRLLVLRI